MSCPTAGQLRNKRLLLIRRPQGLPTRDDFRLEQELISAALPPSSNDGGGGVLLQTMYVSIDPAMRGWMSTVKSYLPPVELGSVMRASSIARVLASNVPDNRYPVGSMVQCDTGGVQTYVTLSGKEVHYLTKLPPTPLPVSAYLGVLGTTGLTAYFGLLRIGMPKAGDIVLVSGAAGATGSVVAQIAKLKGCRVIGTAGSDEKCRWLETNGMVDVAINYKSNAGRALPRAIRTACGGGGANVVFDNVGSEFLEAALGNLAKGARIVLCGAISQYNVKGGNDTNGGPRNYMNLLVKRASMKGFVVFDYRTEYGDAIRDLAQWIASGQLKHSEDVVPGIENFHPALLSLFNGTNKGKVVLQIEEDGGAYASSSSLQSNS